DELRDATILVFANKQDLPNAMRVSDVADKLKLHSISQHRWHIESTSATTGQGLYEGLTWLTSNIPNKVAHPGSCISLPTRRICLVIDRHMVSNPIHIKDFRPISLIGVHYKIIAKILANRLSKLIDKIVSKEQTAFIAGRQILDGPLILSEIIDWFKKRRKMLIFKVDFEKAFNSISCHVFLGGYQDSKKLAWIKWSNALSCEKGGLNIGSLKSFNLALLQKWQWTMFSFPNALWVKVIKSLHGQMVASIIGVACLMMASSMSENLVESLTLSFFLLWCLLLLGIKLFRAKFNIFIWRLTLDRLPHRWNLFARCIDISSISCPFYYGNVESSSHILFDCDFSKEVWKLVRNWFDIFIPSFSSFELWKAVLQIGELYMKEKEVNAIKEIEKWLNERKMLTREGMVNEGITLDASLVFKESTDDNTTSTEQQDESSSSRYDADAKKARVDKVLSDITNAAVGPS
nr:ADP-ribosylation factor 2-like [Tanacetum cinerariifolium]